MFVSNNQGSMLHLSNSLKMLNCPCFISFFSRSLCLFLILVWLACAHILEHVYWNSLNPEFFFLPSSFFSLPFVNYRTTKIHDKQSLQVYGQDDNHLLQYRTIKKRTSVSNICSFPKAKGQLKWSSPKFYKNPCQSSMATL